MGLVPSFNQRPAMTSGLLQRAGTVTTSKVFRVFSRF